MDQSQQMLLFLPPAFQSHSIGRADSSCSPSTTANNQALEKEGDFTVRPPYQLQTLGGSEQQSQQQSQQQQQQKQPIMSLQGQQRYLQQHQNVILHQQFQQLHQQHHQNQQQQHRLQQQHHLQQQEQEQEQEEQEEQENLSQRDPGKLDSGSLTLNLMQSWSNKNDTTSPAIKDSQESNKHQQQLFVTPSPQITQSTRSPLLSMGTSSAGTAVWSPDQDLAKMMPLGSKSSDPFLLKSPNGAAKGKEEGGQHLSSGSDDEDDLEDESMSLGGEEGSSRKRKGGPGKGKGSGGALPHAMSHLMTERRRRERLNSQFLALRAVVPNITKMNKLSTLEDAINYIKSLQQKVTVLEKKLTVNGSGEASAPTDTPQGSHSNVSSPSTMDTLRRMGPRQSLLGRQSDLLALSEVAEKLPVDVEVKLLDGEQFMVNVRGKRRRGLLVEVGAAMELASLDIQQASIMSTPHSISVGILTTKIGEERKIQSPNLEAGLKEVLSVQRRALAAYVSNLCGENSSRH